MTILVTGGTGTLGGAFARIVARKGHDVRIMSRSAQASGDAAAPFAPRRVRADLATGDGVEDAIRGVDIVLHAATQPGFGTKKVDVDGTRRLLHAACAAGVEHVLYPSIVGLDEIPLGYYRHKRTAEGLVAASPMPHTLLRATQFHELVDGLCGAAARLPFVLLLPTDFQVQSVAAADVAQHLADHVERPAGRLPDFGGPEVLRLGAQARAWLQTHTMQKRLVRLPLPGRVARAFRQGKNTTPAHRSGTQTWRDWLDARR